MPAKKKSAAPAIVAKKRANTPCVYSFFKVKSPYMGTERGEVLKAALPNSAKKSFGKEATSYVKPYLIQEFAITSDKDVERAVRSLRELGYDPLLEG